MSAPKPIDVSSETVNAHLNNLQAVITRMASNSASCKTWCITLVAAILLFVSKKEAPELIVIAAIPVIFFGFLDVYYLVLENRFRESYNKLVEKIQYNHFYLRDLYEIKPDNELFKFIKKALKSPSILPFYGGLLLVIWFFKEHLGC